MARGILVRGLLLCVLAAFVAGCSVHTLPAPPPPKVEIRPAKPAGASVWVSGHWSWKGPKKGYVWVPGHWKRP